MREASPFPASVLRQPSASARCTCVHWPHCDCACHQLHCDPADAVCDVAFLPDDGGLVPWGCPSCTPGQGAPHDPGCEVIGWNVPIGRGA